VISLIIEVGQQVIGSMLQLTTFIKPEQSIQPPATKKKHPEECFVLIDDVFYFFCKIS
jgi:hypothetical protein